MAALTVDVGNVLVEAHALDEGLCACSAAIVRHLGALRVAIWTLDDEHGALVLQASASDGGATAWIRLGDGAIGRAASDRRAHTGDVRDLNYPLVVAGRLTGVLCVDTPTPLDAITPAGLAVIAQGLALGIDRQRREAHLRAEIEVVATIHRRGAK
jgi:GAF domain-containing protein